MLGHEHSVVLGALLLLLTLSFILVHLVSSPLVIPSHICKVEVGELLGGLALLFAGQVPPVVREVALAKLGQVWWLPAGDGTQ